MKLNSLSDVVRSIGLITVVSILIGTTVQQTVKAQAQTQTQVPTIDELSCVPPEEASFRGQFAGITFTPEQMAAYQESMARRAERFTALSAEIEAKTQTVDDPTPGALTIVATKEDGIPEEISAQLDVLTAALDRDNLPNAQRVELINQQFGDYLEASISQIGVGSRFTPEQIAEGRQIGYDFDAEMMAVLTPEQQEVFRSNLIIERQIIACMEPDPSGKLFGSEPELSAN